MWAKRQWGLLSKDGITWVGGNVTARATEIWLHHAQQFLWCCTIQWALDLHKFGFKDRSGAVVSKYSMALRETGYEGSTFIPTLPKL